MSVNDEKLRTKVARSKKTRKILMLALVDIVAFFFFFSQEQPATYERSSDSVEFQIAGKSVLSHSSTFPSWDAVATVKAGPALTS
jgi:hypothetical protein